MTEDVADESSIPIVTFVNRLQYYDATNLGGMHMGLLTCPDCGGIAADLHMPALILLIGQSCNRKQRR